MYGSGKEFGVDRFSDGRLAARIYQAFATGFHDRSVYTNGVQHVHWGVKRMAKNDLWSPDRESPAGSVTEIFQVVLL